MAARLTANAAREQVMLQQLKRVERLVTAQRRRLQRYEAHGLDLSQALSLLKLMESVVEQFHVAWRLFHTYGRPASGWLAAPSPGEAAFPAEGSSATTTLAPEAGVPDGSSPVARVPEARRGDAHVPCPYCGLTLKLGGENGALMYNINEWLRRCRYPALQTPVLCQLLLKKQVTVH